MSKSRSLKDNNNIHKYYIVTRPTRLSDLKLEELEDEEPSEWKDKSRNLQLRRWRKIKHQLA